MTVVGLSPASACRYSIEGAGRYAPSGGNGTVVLTCAQCGPFLDLGQATAFTEVLREVCDHEARQHRRVAGL